MNRRDVIIISLILSWSGLWIIGSQTFGVLMTSAELIASFSCTLLMLLVSLIIVTVLSLTIKRFGKWGDKKLIDKRKIAHRRWIRRRNRAWNIACHKAYDGYNEDVTACDPMFYFWNELNGLKHKK